MREQSPFLLLIAIIVLVLSSSGLLFAQGGCGAACIPLEAIDPERPQVDGKSFRVLTTTEYGRFDNFREGGESLTNPGGNEATISLTSTFFEYGVNDYFTASFLVPYIHKVQKTNRFGKRVASGFGDVAIFSRFQLPISDAENGPSFSVGLGLKFPTGGIDEPQTGDSTLPPPFQIGSGAFDLVPTISYYHGFRNLSFFANAFFRCTRSGQVGQEGWN